ncbi:hypothetical protein KP509_1Z291100 [Ceratopteris richardii]|nr:hypothetical protein KP509_1Z291100 [Ceratopteris richardii]
MVDILCSDMPVGFSCLIFCFEIIQLLSHTSDSFACRPRPARLPWSSRANERLDEPTGLLLILLLQTYIHSLHLPFSTLTQQDNLVYMHQLLLRVLYAFHPCVRILRRGRSNSHGGSRLISSSLYSNRCFRSLCHAQFCANHGYQLWDALLTIFHLRLMLYG